MLVVPDDFFMFRVRELMLEIRLCWLWNNWSKFVFHNTLFFNYSCSAVTFFAHTKIILNIFAWEQKKLQPNDWSKKIVSKTPNAYFIIHSKIILKVQILKKALKQTKTLKKQQQNPTFLSLSTEGRNFLLTFLEST